MSICETQRQAQDPTQSSGRYLIVAVLPLNGKHIRERIKHWGDIAAGMTLTIFWNRMPHDLLLLFLRRHDAMLEGG